MRISPIRNVSVLVVAVLLFTGCGDTGPSEQAQQLQTRVDSLQTLLQDARAKIQKQEEVRKGRTLEVLPVSIYFETGSANLSKEGLKKLASVAERIKNNYSNRGIRIEGFADPRPLRDALKERYETNWILSAARAGAVARYLQWQEDIPGSRIEIVGFGSYRVPPGVSSQDPDYDEMRRVRVAVLPEGFGVGTESR